MKNLTTTMSGRGDQGWLRDFVNPRSVALIGVGGDRPSQRRLLGNMRDYPFSGDLYYVNPSRVDEGYFASITDIDAPVDLAVVAVGVENAVKVVSQCAAHGVRGVVLFAAGFSEKGDAGRAAQTMLTEVTASSGMRLLGPNCNGFVNALDGVAFSTANLQDFGRFHAGGTSFVGHSGWVLASLLHWTRSRNLPLGVSVSLGNEADTTAADVITELLLDERTRSIGAYLENLRDIAGLISAGRLAKELDKSLAVLIGGKSSMGRGAAATHTGALMEDSAGLENVIRSSGIHVVDTIEDLAAVSHCMAVARTFKSPVAYVLSSGGSKVLFADAMAAVHLPLADFGPATRRNLTRQLPRYATIDNPLDYTAGFVDDSGFSKLVSAVLDDANVGAVVVQPPADLTAASERMLVFASSAETSAKTVVVHWPAAGKYPEIVAMLRRREVWVALNIPETMAVLCALRRASIDSPSMKGSAERAKVSPPASTQVSQGAARKLLGSYGIHFPMSLETTRSDLAQNTFEIGFPLYLKVQSQDLIHKERVGGVRYVRSAYELEPELALLDCSLQAQGLQAESFLIERAEVPLAEFFVGFKRHPELGPLAGVGAGGRLSEGLGDVAVDLCPESERDAERLVLMSRYGRAVRQLSHQVVPTASWDALLLAITVLTELAHSRTEISEIDLNPLAVVSDARGVVALDCAVIASEPAID